MDKVKAARGWETDYRLAKELGINKQTVSSYRGKVQTLDEDTAMKVAKALGINAAGVILDQVAERTKDTLTRSTVSRMAGELCILCKQTGAMLLIAACAHPKRRTY